MTDLEKQGSIIITQKETNFNFKKVKQIKLNKIIKAKWNYKIDDDEQLKKLTANIKRNGQVELLQVRLLSASNHNIESEYGFYECTNGNHRTDAFRRLNYDLVGVYDLGEISKSEAVRIAIELNETRFLSDHLEQASLINDLSEEFTLEDLESTMPYNDEELNAFSNLLDFNFEQYNEDNDLEDNELSEREKEFKTITLTGEQYDIFVQAKEKMLDGLDNKMLDDMDISNGRVIEYLSAEYLAGDNRNVNDIINILNKGVMI